MKKLEVSVRDKNTLVLESDGIKGDIIDLRELKEFDTVALEEAISKGTDLVYKKKLEEYKNVLDIQNKAIIDKNRSDYELQIKDLKNQIESQNDRSKEKLNEEISKLNAIHKDEINKLKNELDINRQTEKSRTDLLLQEQKNRFDEELNNLKNELDNIKTFEKNKQEMLLQEQKATFEKRIDDLLHQMESNNKLFEAKIKEKELELTNRYDSIISKREQEYINSLNNNERELEKTKAAHLLEIEKKTNELKEEFNAELRKKDDEINLLQRQKASLNVKQTGEDLEAWCDNTVKEAFQNGFECCTWTKDNDVIKEEGENNGSKADYIFRCYPPEVAGKFEWLNGLNPLVICIGVPLFAALTRKVKVVDMMIIGTFVSAATTFLLAPGPNLTNLIIYLVLFSVGEALWSSRFLEYVADLAPVGKVGAYMGLAELPWFLAKFTTGLYSGTVLNYFVPEQGPQASGQMWFIYGIVAMISPVALIIARKWLLSGEQHAKAEG